MLGWVEHLDLDLSLWVTSWSDTIWVFSAIYIIGAVTLVYYVDYETQNLELGTLFG